MPATLNRTTADFAAVVRMFLLDLLPPDTEVILLPENKVAPPKDPFAAITPLFQQGLSTSITKYTDGFRSDQRTKAYSFQLDFYGPQAEDWATIVADLTRSGKACEMFASYGPGILPMYVDDPKQLPFVNGEEQYEQRWMLTLVAGVEQTITTPQESALSAEIGLIEVDTHFPP